MANIYRKTALDKLSSPEQLDRAITVISPSFWIAMIGLGAILLIALLWAIFGRIPINVSADGIYMSQGGMRAVVSETAGLVDAVYVSDGEKVSAGQKLAHINTSPIEEELNELRKRRYSVAKVNFDSENDVSSSDNKSLLDIKAQKIVANATLTTNQAVLASKEKGLQEQRAATDTARRDYEAVRGDYLASMNASGTTAEQLAYQDAQGTLSATNSYYESARSALAQAQEQLTAAQTQTEAQAAQAAYDQAFQAYEAALAEYQRAKANYDAAEDAYIAATNASAAQQGNASQLGALYNVALQSYTSELSAQRSLEDTVAQLRSQVASDQANLNNQNAALKLQFDSAKAAVLDQLDQEIDKRQKQIEDATIRSSQAGFVVGMSIDAGNAIQQGGTVCRISSNQDADQAVICYAVITQGRKMREGMDVMVYPSTINRQEYGHIKGKVLEVSDYVVPAEEMVNQIGDSSLVQMFQQRGPVVRVLIELETDENTASGYRWSSRKGAEVELAEGTIISADVVTEYKAPISMIIPYLKEKLSMQKDQSESGQQQQQ